MKIEEAMENFRSFRKNDKDRAFTTDERQCREDYKIAGLR